MTLLLKVCFNFFLFSAILAFPQVNFHLTDQSNDGFEHHCLRITGLYESAKDTQEIISLCLTHSVSNRHLQTNLLHQNFTFNDLRKKNITSEQLYQWSASIDLIEQHQIYLTSNQSSLSNYSFYNCSAPKFGPQCEYEFVYISDDNLTLSEVILQFYQIPNDATSLTCYVHLECDRGLKSLCLDWSEICDGYVHCLNNQIDEKFCWQLQINQCKEDEYRCRNGQCISKQFSFDNSKLHECLDQSDYSGRLFLSSYNYPYSPMLQLEDLMCTITYRFRLYTMVTNTCNFNRRNLLEIFKNQDVSDTLSNLCSFAFHCTFYWENVFSFICKDVCGHEKCIRIINETCPELILTTTAPIAFSHIYVGYLRQSDNYSYWHHPDYICYDDKLCGRFQQNGELIMYNNKTCRRTKDASVIFESPRARGLSSSKHTFSMHDNLQHCNTIFYDDLNICNNSFIYRCQNSSKCISISRLCDGIEDCDYHDDENCTLFQGKCSPMNTNTLFKCSINEKCISLNRVGDDMCDCPSHYSRERASQLCEDEPYNLCDLDNFHLCNEKQQNSYRKKVISFTTICDGFQEMIPILINGTNHTDESECQYWKCNNTYTRCDGLWNCFDGADEVGCDEYSLINCSINHHLCIKPKTFQLMCLPLEQANDGFVDCLGAVDEPKKCRSMSGTLDIHNFYCDSINKTRCVQLYDICRSHCINENEDLFCNLSKIKDLLNNPSTNNVNGSNLLKYFLLLRQRKPKVEWIPFSLEQTVNKVLTKTNAQSPFVRQKTFVYDFRCHRGYPLRLSLDKNQTQNDLICLCPSSYYGDHCQYQSQRVSLTLRFQTYSDSRRTLFAVIILLMDNSSQRTIHSSKQLTYVYVKHCQTKFNFYLTYSSRPKDSNKSYYVHIDIYEKSSMGYRGSLYIPLDFPFLPVHRVSYVLNIPRDNHSVIVTCPKDQVCAHGQCMKYAENENNLTYCHCNEGWSGKDCSIQKNKTCSSDSLFVGMEANNRSICLCPFDKWGPRCYLRHTICQSDGNSTCLNNGQCVLIDDQMVSQENIFCLCPKGFSGNRCEIEDAKIAVSFDKNIILSEVMLVHFIEVRKGALIRTGLTFQSIPLYERDITIRWSHPFHIVFTELSNKTYYLISVEEEYNQSQVIEKLITSSDRCGPMNEYLNQTIVDYPPIRRIKYYHLPCQNVISCFYDEDHFCLCNDFGSQRIANCFLFNSSLLNNCFKLSNCQNEGQCLQDDIHCPQTSRCICRECFYGAVCQFSSSLFDVSLDGIIGSHIQPNLSIHHQPLIIKITLALIVILVVTGFINSLFSFFAFRGKETRRVGCGYYLLGSTVTTLLTSIMLTLKFSILLLSQMRMISDRTFLSFQCNAFDYLLQVCLNMDRWLNGCIAMERAFNIIKGANFNKNKSKTMAKRVIAFLVLMTITSTICDPIHRQLVDDTRDNEEKRVWCIVSYSSQLLHFNQFIHMFHFFVPFLLNIISSLIIIFLATKRRLTIKTDLSFYHALTEQTQQHRHLLIAPLVLVILSLPRLIISFVGGCMQSNRSPWIYLIGYLISFIPPMLTFVIFVLPSKLYKDEFRKTVKQYRETIRKRMSFIRK